MSYDDIGAALQVAGCVLRHAGSSGRMQSAGSVVGKLSLDPYRCGLAFGAVAARPGAHLSLRSQIAK